MGNNLIKYMIYSMICDIQLLKNVIYKKYMKNGKISLNVFIKKKNENKYNNKKIIQRYKKFLANVLKN